MYDSGYATHQDPRLQPNRERKRDTCDDCLCFKELERKQNGLTEYLGACTFEVYQARTLKELYKAELMHVDPTDEACSDFRPDK